MKISIKKFAAFSIVFFAAILFCGSISARAAAFTVNQSNDAGDGTCDATCTLRDAALAANSAPSDDTINFAAGLTTITLSNAEITIAGNGSLAVNGLGANVLTIDGGAGQNRIFFINQNANVIITGVTLTGGNGRGNDAGANLDGAGGAIFVDRAALTLDRVHVTGNSTFSTQSGGGVYYFGGIPGGADDSILNSTFSDNTATNGSGGGFYKIYFTVVIVNSTFSGNAAGGTGTRTGGGGFYIDNSTGATLRSVTVAGNTAAQDGGGISTGSALDFADTIVAGNSAAAANPEIANRDNIAYASSGYNLIGDSAGDAANTGTPIAYQSTDILDTNPALGALANNGGTTPTRALLASSPAIDKGKSFGFSSDQRGLTRPYDNSSIPDAAGGDGADIGAFEVQAAPQIFTVTRSDDRNNPTCAAGDCSLREAVNAANAAPTNDTINFVAGVTNITLANELVVNNAGTLTVTGNGANVLTISGGGTHRIFYTNGAAAAVSGVTLTGGSGAGASLSGYGGAVFANGGSLVLSGVHVTANSAAAGLPGGGVYFSGGTNHQIINSTFSGNNAPGGCGGFSFSTLNSGDTLSVVNSTVSGNTANGSHPGGGFCSDGNTTLRSVTVTSNTADVGGGFAVGGGTLNLGNTIAAGNSAASSAPDIGNFGGTITSAGYNLIGSNQGAETTFPAGNPNANNDIVGAPGSTVNPSLGGLTVNNGGTTPTHALMPDSRAIDKGKSFGSAADQRGMMRPVDLPDAAYPNAAGGDGADIGAFESNQPICAPLVSRTPFDFDGDCKSDISVFRPNADPNNNYWYILRSSTDSVLTQEWGIQIDKPAPADYDGDGKTDIAIWRDEPATPDRANFFILNSATNTVRFEQFGRTGDNPLVVGDWDGDGKADPAVYRAGAAAGAQSYFFYQPSTQAGVKFVSLPWGSAGDKPIRGDFDGDGKQDACVFRPSNNVWFILQSSNNQPRYDSWGISTDKFVAGDYDGDGKTDLAIFRGGVWHIKQSSNNQPLYKYWGLDSDTPAPADYDGDGRTDAAVFRPSNGFWYILQSASNAARYAQFGASGDVPIPSVVVP